METLQKVDLKTIINKSLEASLTYQDYRRLVSDLVESSGTTGVAQTEALVNYTMLNNRRMKRWDKTLKIPEDVKNTLSHFNKEVTWIVLTESWCGDAAHLLPVMNKLATLNDKINFKVVLRDQNKDLMQQFLTHGGESIPKLIMVDNESGAVTGTFGPRPSDATTLVNDYKVEHGTLTPEFKEELQLWYNKDKGQNTIGDIVALLA